MQWLTTDFGSHLECVLRHPEAIGSLGRRVAAGALTQVHLIYTVMAF